MTNSHLRYWSARQCLFSNYTLIEDDKSLCILRITSIFIPHYLPMTNPILGDAKPKFSSLCWIKAFDRILLDISTSCGLFTTHQLIPLLIVNYYHSSLHIEILLTVLRYILHRLKLLRSNLDDSTYHIS